MMLRCVSIAPFGVAGGSPGVLKKCDVGRLDSRFRERLQPAQRKRAIEAHRPGQAPGGDGAPDMAQDEIDDQPPRAAQLIARAGDDDSPTAVPSIAFSSVRAKFSSTTTASAPESTS